MKTVSNSFKSDLEYYGKQITSKIYIGNEELNKNQINSINRYFEGDILKSVMRQCDIELDGIYDFQKGDLVSKINFGVKGKAQDYEFISWNEWIINDIEISEDNQTMKLICYDKMIYSMIDYDLEVEYPITIGDYLEKICQRLGLTLYSKNFTNSNIEIEEEKYQSLGYTFRDVLDEIAQASAGTIAINGDGQIQVMYPNNTGIKIKGDKEGNTSKLTIGKRVGPINSIVIARTPQEDNIYKKDENSILKNDLYEIKIENNQIMDSHREDFIDGIFYKLNGLIYYTYELESFGICYLDLMDMFEIKGRDDVYYPTIMLNDDIKINQDLWEISDCKEPKITVTDYLSASETDKTLLKTIIKVNKQEGKITELVEKTDEYSNKLAQQQITIDTIEQLVSGEYGLDRETSISKTIHIDNANESKPLDIKIYGYSQPHLEYYFGIDYLGLSYLMSDKEEEIPKITLCIDKQSQNNPSSELKQIELNIVKPLRSLNNIKDELHISLNKETEVLEAQITRYLDYVDGHVVKLKTPLVEFITIEDFQLFEKTNYIYIKEKCNYSLYLRYLVYSELNKNYATKAELNSSIKQLENEVSIKVNEKLDSKDFTSAEIFAKINNDESEAGIKADKIKLEGLTTINEKFKIDEEGKMSCDDADIVNSILSNVTIKNGHLTFDSNDGTLNDYFLKYIGGSGGFLGINTYGYHQNGLGASVGDPTVNAVMGIDLNMANYHSTLELTDWFGNVCHVGTDGISLDGPITCKTLTQTSLKSKKKNIKKFKNGLELINNSDIYTFNYKNEEDEDKKHIGLVIGNKYNTPSEVISKDGNSIDLYSMIGVAWQTIKELNSKIEKLEKQIKELEGEKNG